MTATYTNEKMIAAAVERRVEFGTNAFGNLNWIKRGKILDELNSLGIGEFETVYIQGYNCVGRSGGTAFMLKA